MQEDVGAASVEAERPSHPKRVARRRPSGRSLVEELLRGLVVIAAGLVLGGLTSPAQQYLPDAVVSFANSNGGWTMLTFLVVWVVRARPAWALLHGVLAFEALVEGYAIVSALRGYFYAQPLGSVYAVAGLLAGPVVGGAAALVRWAGPQVRVLGVAVLSGILVADGVSSAIRVGDTTGYAYWIIQTALGIAFLALAIVRERPRIGVGFASVGIIALVSVVYPVLVHLVLERS